MTDRNYLIPSEMGGNRFPHLTHDLIECSVCHKLIESPDIEECEFCNENVCDDCWDKHQRGQEFAGYE